jgi:hypothetical protein
MGRSEEEIRRAIQRRIEGKALPQGDVSHRVYGGVGDGSAECSCCGDSIGSQQIQYEVELSAGASLPMHRGCYHSWRAEAALRALAAERSVQVFQIAYSLELLTGRSTLLAQSGYRVTSALGNEAAKTLLQEPGRCFDVFVIGRAAPRVVRFEMARWIRAHFPSRRIVALHCEDDQELGDLRYNANDHRPERWLPAIAAAARNGIPSSVSDLGG